MNICRENCDNNNYDHHDHNKEFNDDRHYAFVIFGVPGDLVVRKIYPALWHLYKSGKLPTRFNIIGFGKTDLEPDRMFNECVRYIVKENKNNNNNNSSNSSNNSSSSNNDNNYDYDDDDSDDSDDSDDDSDDNDKVGSMDELNEFRAINHYIVGDVKVIDDYKPLREKLIELENSFTTTNERPDRSNNNNNRIFYLALPPKIFVTTAVNIKRILDYDNENDGGNDSSSGNDSSNGNGDFVRIIVEKPFGHDAESAARLNRRLLSLYGEKCLYRVDHYLTKELLRTLLIMRFANYLFRDCWDSSSIASIIIVSKEDYGVEGRESYFDRKGIVRDMIQNHILQIVSLIAMEKPITLTCDHIRDSKTNVLKRIQSLKLSDVLLGQYVAADDNDDDDNNNNNINNSKRNKRNGYKDSPLIPKDSRTPTYALISLQIENERWNGVPFIIKCGKALNERKLEIRIQFRDNATATWCQSLPRNELVIRIQPNEAILARVITKKINANNNANNNPNNNLNNNNNQNISNSWSDLEVNEMDLIYKQRYPNVRIAKGYDRLLLDVMRGYQTNFVRSEELEEAWRIVTPILNQMDTDERIVPLPYKYGSRGPEQADQFILSHNYKYYSIYKS